MPTRDRYEFASDNTAAICPGGLGRSRGGQRSGAESSYGEDHWTKQVCEQVREIFETDCETFFVFNGTAANSLALAQLCRPFQSVLCHEHSHIETDECGAPEFFSGGSKLLRVGGSERQARPRGRRGSPRAAAGIAFAEAARAQRHPVDGTRHRLPA